jgi:hypothetical protein
MATIIDRIQALEQENIIIKVRELEQTIEEMKILISNLTLAFQNHIK